MAVIRCRLSKDGKLILSTVEFEKGDRIHFKSNQPVHVNKHDTAEIGVKAPFPMSEIIVSGEKAVKQINIGDVSVLYNPPPGPPGQPPITIVVTETQAGAAGGGD
jgi:hypothetical protein